MLSRHKSPAISAFSLCVAAALMTLSQLAWVPDAHAGKLKQLRKETRKSSSNSSNHSSSSGGDYSSGGSAEDGVLAMYVVTSPWWVPYHLTGDRYGRTWAFADYPYANGASGLAQIQGVSRPTTLADGRQLLGQGGALALRVEGGTLNSDGPLDQNLSRVTLGARLMTNFRLEFDTEWTMWSEQLVGGKDQLWLGKANAMIVYAQNEHVRFRTGMGLRFLVDEVGTESGINFAYGVDLFPANPIVISAVAEAGTIGDAVTTQVRISAGMVIKGVELFVAYDRQDVNDLVFGGPTVGIRSWH